MNEMAEEIGEKIIKNLSLKERVLMREVKKSIWILELEVDVLLFLLLRI